MPPPSRPLLLCFDAFGTLFHPRQPIERQYLDTAQALGVSLAPGTEPSHVRAAFRNAFHHQTTHYPNYGKQSGMHPDAWWATVITQTLRPLLAPHACPDLPPAVIPRLIDRFRSREAYTLAPGVPALLRALRGLRRRGQRPAVVAGVVSNSDARVPAVLASLGVRVGAAARGSGGEADLAFVVSSYDVGVEKPGAGIFVAAEREGEEEGGWGRRVYVGDEYGKDVCGAVGAGWDAVLVDSEAREERVRWRGGEDDRGETLEEVFQGGNAVGARSLDVVARWLDQGGGG